MGRHREFDPETVVAAALPVFWRQGFATTSVPSLVKATGVAHAGLYAAFGSKRGLFLAALRAYVVGFGARFIAPLEAPGASVEAISRFFAAIRAGFEAGEFQYGCFACASLAELAVEDEEVSALVAAHYARLEAGFVHSLSRSHLDEVAAARLAAGLLAAFITLTVMARAGFTRDRLEAVFQDVAARLAEIRPSLEFQD